MMEQSLIAGSVKLFEYGGLVTVLSLLAGWQAFMIYTLYKRNQTLGDMMHQALLAGAMAMEKLTSAIRKEL